jgi:hypothetical protein
VWIGGFWWREERDDGYCNWVMVSRRVVVRCGGETLSFRAGCMPMARSSHSCKESHGSSWAGPDLWSCTYKYVFQWHRR